MPSIVQIINKNLICCILTKKMDPHNHLSLFFTIYKEFHKIVLFCHSFIFLMCDNLIIGVFLLLRLIITFKGKQNKSFDKNQKIPLC